ncbi:MAG: acylneuraminate cytidylyltransferase family protein [Kiritimatiellae bacterium]|nr:acylneuraminate cytidylyltransferase family protein [Kiritimatiellia bacterium]
MTRVGTSEREPRVVAIIPARGGSKGVPRKNVRAVAGRPLLAWSIADCLESRRVSSVFVSTDDGEIKRVAEEAGATVIERPVALAQDATSSEAALLHALDVIAAGPGGEPDLVVFLQATCPLRRGADIDAAIDLLEQTQADSVLSVSPSHVFLWEERDGEAVAVNRDWRERPRRQDMTPRYRENGSIYVFKPWVLREGKNRLGGKIVLFKMSEEAGVDIDSEHDLELADFLLRREETRR